MLLTTIYPSVKSSRKDIKGYYLKKKPWYKKRNPNPNRKKPKLKNPKPYPTVNDPKQP